MAVKVKLQSVRLAFPKLFERDQYGNHSATFIIEPNTPAFKSMESAIAQVVQEDLKGKKPASDKICMRKSSDKGGDYDGFTDANYALAANRKESFKPNQLINRDKTPIESESVLYPGAFVNAVVSVWAQDNSWGKRVNAELVGVQFNKDGERLGRGSTSIDDDDFEELPELESEGGEVTDFF